MGRFKRIQSIGTLILFIATPNAVFANDDEYYRNTPLPYRLLPEYLPCSYKGVNYACFDFDKVIELNKLELHARFWHDQWVGGLSKFQLAESQLKKQGEQITAHLEIEHENDIRINALQDQASQCIEDKNMWRAKAENPPTWPMWTGGIIAVLGLGAFLGSLFR